MMQISNSRPYLADDEMDDVLRTLKSGMIASGAKVLAVQDKLTQWPGIQTAVATSSGTNALILALKLVGVTADSEVMTPTYTCTDVLNAIEFLGAKPVLVDTTSTWIMNVEEVKQKITNKTKAILAIHTFGVKGDFSSLKGLQVPIIEDCAHAFCQKDSTTVFGETGDLTVLSFQATKMLTSAEGGAVLLKNSRYQQELNRYATPANNPFRMSDVGAAILLKQLERMSFFLKRRQELAIKYFKELPEELTSRLKSVDSCYYRFPIYTQGKANEWMEALATKGILARRGVDNLLHFKLGSNGSFKNAEDLLASTVSIPFYPALSETEVDHILSSVKEIYRTLK